MASLITRSLAMLNMTFSLTLSRPARRPKSRQDLPFDGPVALSQHAAMIEWDQKPILLHPRTVWRNLFLICLFGCSGLARAADWPQWRGPDRNGVVAESPPLADAWPSGGPRLLWRTESLMNGGKATGHSSPAVAGGRVYLHGNWSGAASAGGAFDAVACVNAVSGQLVWSAKFPAEGEDDPPGRAHSSTPCVINGRLYLACRNQVYCLDTRDGQPIWQQPIETPHD